MSIAKSKPRVSRWRDPFSTWRVLDQAFSGPLRAFDAAFESPFAPVEERASIADAQRAAAHRTNQRRRDRSNAELAAVAKEQARVAKSGVRLSDEAAARKQLRLKPGWDALSQEEQRKQIAAMKRRLSRARGALKKLETNAQRTS